MPHHHPSEETSKASLRAWWKQFTAKNAKRENEVKGKGTKGIFGVRLSEGIEYASVPICMAGADGQQYVYGYIPTIVAKCGMYLKEQATTTEGIFRLSGSAKRIKELQTIFDSPPSYGKTLTWVGYSVHDAANILRRYLNHLPDPVIPHQWYEQFRSVHDTCTDVNKRVQLYQKLIAKLPKENQHLLLYILDLLAVFSSKSVQNLMSAKNLASIFQPGILSHPDHDMAPEEYKLSQEVLEFLIDYQNYFLMPGGQENNKTTTISNNREAQGGSTKRDIRSSLSLEHRSKSTDSITMLSDVNNEQDTNEDLKRRQDQQNTTSTTLVRENTTGSLKRSKTLPSKRPKYEGAQKRNDGTQTTPTTGSSNDINKEDKKSKKRQSLVQLVPLITLPKGNNNDRSGKSSQKSRKKSLSISSTSLKRTSRYNKNGTSGNIEPINISSVSSSMKSGPSSPRSLSSPKSLTSPSSLSGKKLVDVMSDEKENASITSSLNSSVIKRRKRGDKKGKNAQETQEGREDNGKERMNFLLELRRKMWFSGGGNGGSGSSGSSIGSRNSMLKLY
uniref:Rho-GAP domain-containing protein n=1 Tax=Rhizophagus irregularis (strain DAOM 181602 / DAOM 197198 / MUCL 43194) TaxID=747089 RepID=U9SYT7_RHIID